MNRNMKQKVKERRKNQRRREGEEKRPLDLIFFFFRFFSCFVPIHFVEKYKERCHRRLLREGARECWRGRCLQQRHRRKSRGEKSRGVVLKLTRLARSVTVLCQGRSTLGDVGIERRVVDVFIALAARALGGSESGCCDPLSERGNLCTPGSVSFVLLV